MENKKIIALDFDGCVVTNKYPEIGEPIEKNIRKLKEEQEAGAKVILWTNRRGDYLKQAVDFCNDYGIRLDAVNANLPEIIEAFGGDTRKIFATEYWDDRAVFMGVFSDGGLGELPQYHIDRDVLCKIVEETVGYDRLIDSFDSAAFTGENFTWFRKDDEFYIVHMDSGMMINWYKHLGRTNTCSQSGRTVNDYYTFFKLFKDELDYWEDEEL